MYLGNILFTFLAGIALGFLGSSILPLLIVGFVLTILVTVVGMYTGYRLGFEYKMRAYVFGGLLLVAGGAGVVFGYM